MHFYFYKGKKKVTEMRNRRLLAFSFVAVSCLDRSRSGAGLPAPKVSGRGYPGYPRPAATFVGGTVAQRCPSTRAARTQPRQLLPARLQAATFCPLIESRRLGNAFPIRGPKLGCSLAGAGKDAPLCNRRELIAPDDLNNAMPKAKLGLEPAPHLCGALWHDEMKSWGGCWSGETA